ncbi:AraC family transcriptional regulator [Cytophagaceae bacterium DM2B3-1]|uniref:AraC family transcriptional regulator n=1 Tax=Xanthocytophaga flava TaxID=3048013 RepID=A0ABT7CYA2_9BACT|nr:AraC family transcriptional regulator [Xanthocytophaga flavus]MDJ1498753.1 AraC family transcriptional regulator [Xanthocytophaga flavus]
MKTHIHINKNADLIESLSTDFYTIRTKDSVDLPSGLGSGTVKGFYFPSQLNVYIGSHHLHLPWQLETINEQDSTTFCIFASIVSNKITIKKDGEWVDMNHNGPNSILFYSAGSSVEIAFPPNEPFKTLFITFTSETIRAIIDQPEVLKGLTPGSPFLYLSETTPEAVNLIRKLGNIYDENGPSRFEMYITLLNLLRLTLYRTFVSKERYNYSGLLKEDVEKLFSIRRRLIENSHLTLKIATLAEEVGMSESKMIKLFKQVFSYTVYQFAQKAKIIKAKDLLTTRNYNVSEVGYMVGYSNMTHFAKAFKKHYKVNPSEYLKSVLSNRTSTYEIRPTQTIS